MVKERGFPLSHLPTTNTKTLTTHDLDTDEDDEEEEADLGDEVNTIKYHQFIKLNHQKQKTKGVNEKKRKKQKHNNPEYSMNLPNLI